MMACNKNELRSVRDGLSNRLCQGAKVTRQGDWECQKKLMFRIKKKKQCSFCCREECIHCVQRGYTAKREQLDITMITALQQKVALTHDRQPGPIRDPAGQAFNPAESSQAAAGHRTG